METTLGLAVSLPGSVEEVIYSGSCRHHAAYIRADNVVASKVLIREKSQEHGGVAATTPTPRLCPGADTACVIPRQGDKTPVLTQRRLHHDAPTPLGGHAAAATTHLAARMMYPSSPTIRSQNGDRRNPSLRLRFLTGKPEITTPATPICVKCHQQRADAHHQPQRMACDGQASTTLTDLRLATGQLHHHTTNPMTCDGHTTATHRQRGTVPEMVQRTTSMCSS